MSDRKPATFKSPRPVLAKPRLPDGDGAVQAAIRNGFVVGREVLIGAIPGIVVGYNIGGFSHFVGTLYPIVVRTALGVAKCRLEELELI